MLITETLYIYIYTYIYIYIYGHSFYKNRNHKYCLFQNSDTYFSVFS
ncbi:MAG: hypothetical protein N7Q72_02680 [Spiroplasma sp. Tabriz.8]|nr:hypothetical protein [Spiroplasma sp. Tabriz.8]